MSVLPFETRRQQWGSVPIDDIGYFPSAELLDWQDSRLQKIVRRMERTRYNGWRNHKNAWRDVLGLNRTRGAHVLDYGCGIGVEALQYAHANNKVSVADIVPANVSLACRVLRLFGHPAENGYLIEDAPPFLSPDSAFDVIHSAGVLHHIPEPEPVVRAMQSWLVPGGELRLMLYSDVAWRLATGTDPPDRVENDPHFRQYWTQWDPIGGYADWYDQERLEQRFGEWFTVKRCEPLTERGEYLGAVLTRL